MSISIKQRNAAFDAVKPLVLKLVPPMFHSYITDSVILEVVDAALNAAAKIAPDKIAIVKEIN
jgi:hypothetical protein